jgi:glucosamine--fructose-6-phosphate aminotransferase (isomerizing)
MSNYGALISAECRQAPDVVRRQAEALAQPLSDLVHLLRNRAPQVVVTCARGSSAHAATFGKYLIERYLGIPVAEAAPSITSVYRKDLRLDGQLFLAISQSGRSEDLIESAASAKASGALTAAIVNDTDSPLASTCDVVLPMAAGPELSVAATKTFIASLGALLNLVAVWAEDRLIKSALDRLPERLAAAADLDWSKAFSSRFMSETLVMLGRGPTLAIAREASLKLKEVCNIHAEAFSGAEFQHGPITLVSEDYPVLIFAVADAAGAHLTEVAADLCQKGASVLITSDSGMGTRLPTLAPDHPDTDTVCLIQSFYALALNLARRRGINVDQPRHLRKITRTR